MVKHKWLIIGTSEIAMKFASTLQSNNQEIVGVIGTSAEKSGVFANHFRIARSFNSKDVGDLDYDCVYVATPNIFHYDYAKHFIVLGKNVLVEKIMTHSPVLTKELFDLSVKHNVRVMEAYAHIYPEFLSKYRGTGKELKVNFMKVSSKIKNNTAASASSFSKSKYGGALPDLGVYPISLAVWICGPVNQIEIINNETYEGVEIDVTYKLFHRNGSLTYSRVSKIEDGDNAVYLDKVKILERITLDDTVGDRMSKELEVFLNGDYKFSWEVSNEVARVVDSFKNILGTK